MFDRKLIYGLTFIALIGALIVGTVAVYRGALRSSVPLAVETDRAGLTLAVGAPVKLRGVEIGRVGKITQRPGAAGAEGAVTILLEIATDKFDRVPGDVTAQIIPP